MKLPAARLNTYVSGTVWRCLRRRNWAAAIAAIATIAGAGTGGILSHLALQARSESNSRAVLIVAALIAALFAYGSHCISSKKSRIDLRGTNLKVVS